MRPRRLWVLGWLALIGLLAPGAAGEILEAGDILVSDRGAGAVIRIKPTTAAPTVLDDGYPSLRGILADRFGSVFLTESVFGQVVHLDPDTLVRGLLAGTSGFTVPEAIVHYESDDGCDGPDECLLVSDLAYSVWRLDAVVGNPEAVAFGTPGVDSLEGLAIDDATGLLYMANSSTARPGVYKVDLKEPLPHSELEPVLANGPFLTPKDVALSPDGNLLVADRFAHTVFRVNVETSEYVPVVTGLSAPVGLYIYQNADPSDPSVAAGDFLVADFGAGAVYHYDNLGVLKRTFTDGLVGPWRVTVVEEVKTRSERPFLVSDTEEKELYELTPDSTDPAAAARTPEPHEMNFEAPAGVAVDIDGTSLVCDGDDETTEQSLFRVTESQAVHAGPPFEQPNRVVVYDYGTIPGSPSVYFVADPGAGAILKLEDVGAGYTALPLLPPCGEQNYLVEPVALAIDHDGLLVVLNRDMGSEDRKPLVRVNPENGFQNPLPLDSALVAAILDPVDLAIDANDEILLADQGDPEADPKIPPLIFRLDGVTGAAQPGYYYEGYSYELQEYLFHTLEGIALDENRELLVTDSGDADADPAVIRIDTTFVDLTLGYPSIVEIGTDQSWLRPNGIALKQTATPPAILDLDGDTVADRLDNCPEMFNPTQQNGLPCNNCPDGSYPDLDGDGVGDACDNCPDDFNSTQENSDGDELGDACDNCPEVDNSNQVDTNSDGIGNRCDPDYNNDGKVDTADFIILSTAWGGIPDADPPDPRYDPDVDSFPDPYPDPPVGIGTAEFILLSQQWGQAPGPGLPACHD